MNTSSNIMKMKTLRASVQGQAEVERKSQAWWEVPIIPFIPHESGGEDSRDSFIEILIKVNMEERSGPNNQVKMNFKKFTGGHVEDLIKWRQDLDQVIRSKPVKDPKSQFDMAEMLLGDDPQATFKEYRRTVCYTVDVEGRIPGVKPKSDKFLGILAKI